MKVSLAAHPDWDRAMSNPPNPPPTLDSNRPKAHAPATERHAKGRALLSHLLNYWLDRGQLTQRQLAAIAAWGLDEAGWLHDTKITFLRKNQFSRQLPSRYMDALGAANVAIWRWQVKGEQEAITKLGPPSKNRVKTEWLDRTIWLPHPDYPDEPLSPADFFDISAGYLDIPYVAGPILAPSEGPELTEEVCQLLFKLVEGLSMREQLRTILRAYPAADKERRDRLGAVLMGATTYTKDELESELFALAQVVRILRGLDFREYGPSELFAEVSAARKQTGGARDDQE